MTSTPEVIRAARDGAPAQTLEELHIMRKKIELGAELECLECGACCFSTLPTYLNLDGDDHERLGDDAERLTVFLGNRCYMRLIDGHCAALRVDSAERRFVCTVYDRTRPWSRSRSRTRR